MITICNAPAPAQTTFCCRKPGRSWPLARHAMIETPAIRVRLREDVEGFADIAGVQRWQLVELGWTRRQLDNHLPAVLENLAAAA